MTSIFEKLPEKKTNMILLILAFTLLACIGLRTISNVDIWSHLSVGRYIVTDGIPHEYPLSIAGDGSWVNTTWLYDYLMYHLWQIGGAPLVTTLHILSVLAAFALLIPVAAKKAGKFSIIIALILSSWLLAPRFEIRPNIFVLIFPALYLFLHKRLSFNVIFLIMLPLQILWTNMHSSFIIGPCILFAFVVEDIFDIKSGDPKHESAILMTLLAMSTVAITLCNPYFYELHSHVVEQFGVSVDAYRTNWISPFIHHFEVHNVKHLVSFILLIGIGGLATFKRKLPLGLTILAVLSAIGLVRSFLLLDFCTILLFPFLCLSIASNGRFISEHLAGFGVDYPQKAQKAAYCIVLIMLVSSLFTFITNRYYTKHGSASAFGFGSTLELYPEAAQKVLLDERFPFCSLNLIPDGGYLAWRNPGRKIYIDDKQDVYDPVFFKEYIDALLNNDPESLESLRSQCEFNAVIINCSVQWSGRMIRNLILSRQWSTVYFDGITAILIHHSDEGGLLEDQKVNELGLQLLQNDFEKYKAKTGKLLLSPLPPRLIGAASIFLELNQFREAAALYSLLSRLYPTMGGAFYGLGLSQLRLGDTEKSINNLEKANEIIPGNSRYLGWLSRAYAEGGYKRASNAAYEKMQKIDPELAESYGNPSIDKK